MAFRRILSLLVVGGGAFYISQYPEEMSRFKALLKEGVAVLKSELGDIAAPVAAYQRAQRPPSDVQPAERHPEIAKLECIYTNQDPHSLTAGMLERYNCQLDLANSRVVTCDYSITSPKHGGGTYVDSVNQKITADDTYYQWETAGRLYIRARLDRATRILNFAVDRDGYWKNEFQCQVIQKP